MMIQKFHCETCDKQGEAYLSDDVSILAAINEIKSVHALLSPDCPFDSNKIIVHQPEFVEEADE